MQTPAPRCFVLAGLTTQLDTAEMKRSFELYRQGVANVTIIAFDELLGQIEHLRDYLRGDAESVAGGEHVAAGDVISANAIQT